MQDPFKRAIGVVKSQYSTDQIVLDHTRKKKNIIYGARSVKKQLGVVGRQTVDYDIYSRQPARDAEEVKNKLNNVAKTPLYYTKQSKFHAGTHKIYYVGRDGIPYTKDDRGVIDYSEMKKGVKYVIINGVRYSLLDQTVSDKQSALADPFYKFRHEKDRSDVNRIQEYQRLKRTPIVKNII